MNEGQRSATKGIDGARPRLQKRLGRPFGQQQVNPGRRRSSLTIGVTGTKPPRKRPREQRPRPRHHSQHRDQRDRDPCSAGMHGLLSGQAPRDWRITGMPCTPSLASHLAHSKLTESVTEERRTSAHRSVGITRCAPTLVSRSSPRCVAGDHVTATAPQIPITPSKPRTHGLHSENASPRR